MSLTSKSRVSLLTPNIPFQLLVLMLLELNPLQPLELALSTELLPLMPRPTPRPRISKTCLAKTELLSRPSEKSSTVNGVCLLHQTQRLSELTSKRDVSHYCSRTRSFEEVSLEQPPALFCLSTELNILATLLFSVFILFNTSPSILMATNSSVIAILPPPLLAVSL